jgi:hypothetical protein
MKTFALTALFLAGTVISAAAAARPSLQQSFRTCENVTGLQLAHDLLWLVPRGDHNQDKLTRLQFERRHRKSIVPGSLTAVPSFEGGGYLETTRVELVGQTFAPGLTPKAMSATTCPEGCDIMAWALEFGKLEGKAKARLTSWVRALPPAVEYNPSLEHETTREYEKTRPTLAEDAKGNVSLVCDLSL